MNRIQFYNNLKIKVPIWKIYARMGGFADPRAKDGKAKNFEAPKAMDELIQKVIKEGYRLIRPRGAVRELVIEKVDLTKKRVVLQAKQIAYKKFKVQISKFKFKDIKWVIDSHDIAKLLKGRERAFLMGVTIGEEIMNEVMRLSDEGKITEAYILDCFASEAAEEVAESLNRALQKNNKQKLTFRFACGYGDWKLQEQKKILQLLNGKKLGMKVNEAFMLIPQKSITGIIGG